VYDIHDGIQALFIVQTHEGKSERSRDLEHVKQLDGIHFLRCLFK